jgi:phage terminase large subunit GpA-like protein
MYLERTLENISERLLLSSCLKAVFRPILRLSSSEWAMKYRSITSTETSFGIGKFDPDYTPYMEYLYDCLDNPYIPVIIGQKSSRIAWTETINNWLGKNIHTNPRNTLIGFPTKDKAKEYGKGKLQPLIENTPILQEAIDVGLSENKKSIFDYNLKGAWLRLRTLGTLVKSDNVPTIIVEEFADTPDNVNNQGDTVAALLDRQKLVPLVMRKFVGGSTPTNMDFCQVERAIKYSNQLVFKAECHDCGELIAMDNTSFAAIQVAEFGERKMRSTENKTLLVLSSSAQLVLLNGHLNKRT